MMADGAMLLVDAAEGPLPQTRFVLRKAPRPRLPGDRGHQQDRPRRRPPHEVLNEVFDLFCDPRPPTRRPTSRCSTRSAARASRSATSATPTGTSSRFFDTVVERVRPRRGRAAPHDRDEPRPTTTHVGRSPSARGRRHHSRGRVGHRARREGQRRGQGRRAVHLRGPLRKRAADAGAGENVAIAGHRDHRDRRHRGRPGRGPPRCASRWESHHQDALRRQNTSPLAGREGFTSRQIRERLMKEARRTPPSASRTPRAPTSSSTARRAALAGAGGDDAPRRLRALARHALRW